MKGKGGAAGRGGRVGEGGVDEDVGEEEEGARFVGLAADFAEDAIADVAAAGDDQIFLDAAQRFLNQDHLGRVRLLTIVYIVNKRIKTSKKANRSVSLT